MVALTLLGYSFYFSDVFAGKTKPHAFSWLVWSILGLVAFFGQLSDNAGPGAWITATTSLVGFIMFWLAITRGEKNITRSDKVNLGATVLAVIPWLLTNDPLLSIVIVIIIDFLGFVPTIRKSIGKPEEETLIHYVLAGLKFALAMVALENFTLITALYPAYLVAANWIFIILLIVQRKKQPQPEA